MTIAEGTLKTGWVKRHPVFIFALKFILVMLVYELLFILPFMQQHVFIPSVDLCLGICNKILIAMGYQTKVIEGVLSVEGFSVGFISGSDASAPMALVVAGILAFRSSFAKKITGIFAGIVILFALNILRIVMLCILGVKNPELDSTFYPKLFELMLFFAAIVIWFVWLNRLMKKPKYAVNVLSVEINAEKV